ncbi:MAG: hypothetical protein HW373_407, partial [Deltaproteobacteria bacterium]|nr:hypothetical protein [Deltaproteobacteria bacterium]
GLECRVARHRGYRGLDRHVLASLSAGEPATTLYTRPYFRLTFPASVDLSRVPPRLWWDVFLLCTHQHWLLLRPCMVHLPLKLSDPEKRFWLQLLQNAVDTLESVGFEPKLPGQLGIKIIDGAIEQPQMMIDGSGFGTAFSSGKDSLLQAALLFELTERPLLVTTTSPLPPLADHETTRRREIFAAIAKRRDPVFVEVVSDFRSNWDNGFAWQNGYKISVNELTDTFLYMSNLLVVGAALGRTRLFLASEGEVQENEEIEGTIIQHPHFMYSAATQRALGRYLEPYGFRFGSLIWPLYSMQVQQLLWARYPDLSDLQYSCWRVEHGQSTCSRCEQCMRIAMTALAAGHNPERMGINLEMLMSYSPDWEPIQEPESWSSAPQTVSAQRSRSLVVGAIKRTSALRLLTVVEKLKLLQLLSWKTWRMLGAYRRLRKRVSKLQDPPEIGVREAFLDWLDPDLRERLVAIYAKHLSLEPRIQHADIFERSHILTERAISALVGHPRSPSAMLVEGETPAAPTPLHGPML